MINKFQEFCQIEKISFHIKLFNSICHILYENEPGT